MFTKPDPRFFETLSSLSIDKAVSLAGAELVSGDGAEFITHAASANAPSLESAVIYLDKKALSQKLRPSNFGICFTSSPEHGLSGGAVAVTDNPKLAFVEVASKLHRSRLPVRRKSPVSAGAAHIEQSAFIDETAEIGRGAYIGANAVIGPGVVVGEGASIGHGANISHAILGDNVRILPGASIGQSGFGFAEGPEGLVKFPQLGRVIVEENVEIGANTTIDRGALDDTVIGAGAKIDNLVQIGHNVRIGRNCIIAAQCGISGSCVIGDGVMMGGQVGLADHLTIGNGAQIAAGSGLMRDVPPGEVWGGRPARPIKDWLRETAVLSKLAKKRNN